MKIAMISEHASPLAALGGVDSGSQNVHVTHLAAALSARNHTVTVYTRRDDPNLPVRVPTALGFDVVHVTAGPQEQLPKDELLPFMGEMAHALERVFKVSSPDIVHAHFWMSGIVGIGATRTLPVPTATTFHALGSVKRRVLGDQDPSPPQRVALECAVARGSDQILATSNEEVFELLRMGAGRHRISLVPSGVDTRHFSPDGAVDATPRRARRIVVVSRLVEHKGIGDVVAALPQVPDTELVVAGGPDATGVGLDPESARLRALARAHGVADRVVLRGRVARSEVPALIRSADLVACTPWYESLGMVALEAMACGVPVVASAVGGLVDTVIDGVTGRLVRPRDVEALAATLRELLAHAELRERLGRAGLQRARSRYNWTTIAGETERAYALACSRARANMQRVG
jgi:glycosyltransferase involved in cell wall biosynthesis